MNDLEIVERLAKLETRMEALEGDSIKVAEKVDLVLQRMEKQQSFIGGVVFVLSAMWGLLYAFRDWIISPK
jgi:hypothetical protein